MVGRRSSASGDLDRVKGSGLVTANLADIPVDKGEAWGAAQKLFAGLGARLGGLADEAAGREGAAAGLEAGRTAGDSLGTAEPQPLALRRDGTIRGEAFDDAAVKAFGWRSAADLRTKIADAYEAGKDDPKAFAAALAKIRGDTLADPSYRDPQLREVFERSFAESTHVYSRSVATRHEARVHGDQRRAASEAVEAIRRDVVRQAGIAGASPDGDHVVGRQLDRAGRTIDRAAEDGAMTAAEAARAKREMAEDAVIARVRGTFDALPDPVAQDRFATTLRERWAAPGGELAGLDPDKLRGLAEGLTSDARRATAAAAADVAMKRRELGSAIEADVASLRQTGKPAEAPGGPLDPAAIERVVGAGATAEWLRRRREAQTLHAATGDMGLLTERAIEARVGAFHPLDTAPEARRLFDQVDAEARRVLALRREDPARAVEEAMPVIRQAKASLDPDLPETYERLAEARLAGQAAVGIPDLGSEPLTRDEARALMRPVIEAAPGQEWAALKGVVEEARMRYGRHGEAVASQLLRVQGVDRATAEASLAVMRANGLGRAPTPAEARRFDRASEIGRAEAAMSGKPRPGERPETPPSFLRAPSPRAIAKLKSDPGLAAAFDEKFGAGTAGVFLAGPAPLPPPDGRTTIAPDGTESWEP